MNLNIWFKRFEEFESFVKDSGRKPSRADSAPDNEKAIAYWLKEQKRNYKSGKLDPKLYELIENVLSNSKTILDLFWETTYEELSYFLRDNEGSAPKRKQNEQQDHLAYWLKDQRNAYDKNLLSEERIRKLDLLKEIYGFDWRIKGWSKKNDTKSIVKSITINKDLIETLNNGQNMSKSNKSR